MIFDITIPSWLVNLATAAFGALIAYAFWSWIHSPHLIISGVARQPIIDPETDHTQYSLRATVQNIGTKSAQNCEATLNLRVEHNNNLIRSIVNLPWLPKKAELLVSDNVAQYQTTIPAGRSKTIELYRQYRNGNIKTNAVASGRRFAEIKGGSDVSTSVDEPAGVAFREKGRSSPNDIAKTSATLDSTTVDNAEWENARLTLTVETESALPLEVSFYTYTDEDGWLHVERTSQIGRKRLSDSFYAILNRIRTGSWNSPN